MKKIMTTVLALSSTLAIAYTPETEVQKLGYTFGTMVGAQLSQGVQDLDMDSFQEGFNAAYKGEEPTITQEEMQTIFQTFQQQQIEKQQKEQALLTEEFQVKSVTWLTEKEAEDGVMKTQSGLLYKVINEGSGAKPKEAETVKVNYEGSLIDGTVFDSSYERGEAISFPLNQVIPGWTEGLQLMTIGSKYEFYIPSDLAYGPGGTGPIPPHSALKFIVELLDIEATPK